MEVTQTKAEGLSRTFAVKVPASELQAKLDARIEEIRPSMRLKGFRPGHVPASHVRKMFGRDLMGEVIDKLVNEKLHKLRVIPSEVCTDEEFIRRAVASDIAARMRYGHNTLAEAVTGTLTTMPAESGGVIAVDARGNVVMEFNTPGMSRATADSLGNRGVWLGRND